MATDGNGQRSTRKGSPNYPIEFKRQLAEKACVPGVSVSRLALEHQLNVNMLFKWRRHYRAGKFGIPSPEYGIAPIQVGQCEGSGATDLKLLQVIESSVESGVSPEAINKGGLIEIELAQATIRLRGAVDSMHIRVVLDCLARQS